MARCYICGRSSKTISWGLNLCHKCIKDNPERVLAYIRDVHATSRQPFRLPPSPPDNPHGITCNICVNECKIQENGTGFCGLRKNIQGRLTGVSADLGNLSWYHDPLPTNCVADWVCPGGSGAGFPRYAHREGPEYGYKNLAVFMQACSFDCLFCQNWHFRQETRSETLRDVQELVDYVDEKTSCICYFGGDPSPQLPFAIRASRLALKKTEGRILRICWETNGTMNRALLEEVIELSLESGGCIKFDLKAWDETLHIALTGVTNRRTLDNFSIVAERIKERPDPPLLIASTLLIPGYIDETEVREIARFISSLNRDIPYALLAFYPHFHMADLPTTSRELAYRCLDVARAEGLRRVRIGNIHLLR